MASTTYYNWPKPTLDDQADEPTQVGAMGDGIDSTLHSAQIGTTTLGANGFTLSAVAGFGTPTVQSRVVNGWAFIQLQVLKTGSTITAPANGNITNTQLGTLAGRLPPVQHQARAYCTGAGGTSVLNTDGTWFLTDLNPTSSVASGDFVRATFVYPV